MSDRPADDDTSADGAATTGNDAAERPSVELRDAQFEALLDAVERDGELRFEALHVADAEDGYVFETGAERREGLTTAELRAAARDRAAVVTNWFFWEKSVGGDGHRRAFLRWLEDADGVEQEPADGLEQEPADGLEREPADEAAVVDRYAALADGRSREWGQLLVTTSLGAHGERRYEVRHVDEADVDAETLDAHDDPLNARRLVKFDDDGRYRPLKTAPTLPTGWVFPDLDHRDCYEAVETIYPATVANWHRERRGDLDVDHWRETMERQTGMFGVIETWDRQEGHEHVNWVAEACCDDSQCLKRREWEYDDETDLDVDGGDGVFPCREPCSVVVSFARRWTKLEAEETRTYEFDLTPGEKEQIEEIIDAVSDDRTDEIREADAKEGANRYRARFLRAKRFDDEGNLCGVPTERDGDGSDDDR